MVNRKKELNQNLKSYKKDLSGITRKRKKLLKRTIKQIKNGVNIDYIEKVNSKLKKIDYLIYNYEKRIKLYAVLLFTNKTYTNKKYTDKNIIKEKGSIFNEDIVKEYNNRLNKASNFKFKNNLQEVFKSKYEIRTLSGKNPCGEKIYYQKIILISKYKK